jgi:hypothetical protein
LLPTGGFAVVDLTQIPHGLSSREVENFVRSKIGTALGARRPAGIAADNGQLSLSVR